MHLYLQNVASVKLLSCVRLFVTLWTVAFQAPPSMEFSRQEYWSGLPFEETWNTERGNWSVLSALGINENILEAKAKQPNKNNSKKNPFPFYGKLMIEIHTKWWTISEHLLVSRSISFQWPMFVRFFTHFIFINKSPFEYFLPKTFVMIKLKITSIKLEKLLS